MRLLCDTQIIIWLMNGDGRIRPQVDAMLADRANDILFSAVSLWEVAIKLRVGKIRTEVAALHDNCVAAGMTLLDIEVRHLVALSRLTDAAHNDPFDHLLIAQAVAEGASLLTSDRKVQRYPVDIIKA